MGKPRSVLFGWATLYLIYILSNTLVSICLLWQGQRSPPAVSVSGTWPSAAPGCGRCCRGGTTTDRPDRHGGTFLEGTDGGPCLPAWVCHGSVWRATLVHAPIDLTMPPPALALRLEIGVGGPGGYYATVNLPRSGLPGPHHPHSPRGTDAGPHRGMAYRHLLPQSQVVPLLSGQRGRRIRGHPSRPPRPLPFLGGPLHSLGGGGPGPPGLRPGVQPAPHRSGSVPRPPRQPLWLAQMQLRPGMAPLVPCLSRRGLRQVPGLAYLALAGG